MYSQQSMLKAFDHEQENFFWHSNLSSKNERNTAIQDSERWMSFNSAYINMALLSKIRTYIKKFYVKIIHYSHSMGIGFHANLVKSMQNVLKKSLRGSKKKKKKQKYIQYSQHFYRSWAGCQDTYHFLVLFWHSILSSGWGLRGSPLSPSRLNPWFWPTPWHWGRGTGSTILWNSG